MKTVSVLLGLVRLVLGSFGELVVFSRRGGRKSVEHGDAGDEACREQPGQNADQLLRRRAHGGFAPDDHPSAFRELPKNPRIGSDEHPKRPWRGPGGTLPGLRNRW